MKKTILKRILVLVIVFLMIISTPFYISENINNNPYANAAAVTFTAALESELFLQTLIPTLISAGLVFTSKESIEKAAEDTIEWLKEQGFDWKPPDEPDGPNLEDVVKEMLKAITLVSASYELVKGIVELPQMLWDLIKSFVDDNYNEGENIEIIGNNEYYFENIKGKDIAEWKGDNFSVTFYYYYLGSIYKTNVVIDSNKIIINGNELNIGTFNENNYYIMKVNADYELFIANLGPDKNLYSGMIWRRLSLDWIKVYEIPELEQPTEINKGYGVTGIVDNQNYDWNNNKTGTKIIPIPIEKDAYGEPIKDENGYYLPSIDTEEWVDVQPTEIPNLDPSGTPIPDIPPLPDIENPDDDEKTGIMVYIGNILQIIVGQLSKIVEGVKTIVSNTNQLVFNTPNPIFDPITGEQIDPETGQPVEPEPVVEEGDGIIGNGIDTNIPTDFEWGSFRHFLDIFFIFIYFIVILILIILKFLQVVFVGIPNIASNTDLFTQYPSILEGVDYVKNLKVGGLTITVHQAFEFVFLIFFYIFIIKQIRKLYNAHVFEESAENQRITKDMKMDYYENIKFNRWSDDK